VNPWIAAAVAVALVGGGGNVWLLAQEARGRIHTRGWNTRVLRWLAAVSLLVVLATVAVARPWYWDAALVLVAGASFAGVLALLRALWQVRAPSRLRVSVLAGAAVVLGVVLLSLAGVAGVLDVAGASSSDPVLGYHGGSIVRAPELVDVFWGPGWSAQSPTVRQVVAFGDAVAGSSWATAVTSSGLGITAITNGGCFIDPTPLADPARRLTDLSANAVANELAAVFDGGHVLSSCTVGGPPAPATLPADAVVALWMPPSAHSDFGGLAAHGAVPWPGRPHGVPVAGLPGEYAHWGLPGCVEDPGCRRLPDYATPSYALSHEALEAITDPYDSGWFASAPLSFTAHYVLTHGPPALFGVGGRPSYPGEVADLCEPGSVAPGQRLLIGRLTGTDGLTVAAFYRPRVGCVAG